MQSQRSRFASFGLSRFARRVTAKSVAAAAPEVRPAARDLRCVTEMLEGRTLFSAGGVEELAMPDLVQPNVPLLLPLPPISPPTLPPIIVDPIFFRDVTVKFNETTVNDGDATPTGGEGTDFGTASMFGPGPTRTFTITNTGNLTVTLGAVGVTGSFSTPAGPLPSLAPGESTSFSVTMTTGIPGNKTGTVSFTTNVTGKNPYNFDIKGSVSGLIVVDPPVFFFPEITVLDGGSSIADGTAAPVNFGSVVKDSASPTKTFTVRNDGTANLTLGAVSVPAGFTLTEPLSASLAPGASDTFSVALNTGAIGPVSGEISFTNNDGNENPFNFAIAGTVTAAPAPAIEVASGDVSLTDGSSSVGFGSVQQGASAPTRTFTVRNTGTAELTLTAPTLPASFTLIEPLNASLAPGASDTFTVSMSTSTVGSPSGGVVIANNDAGKNPFNFNISGTVTTVSSPPVVPPTTPPTTPPTVPPTVPPVVGAGPADDGPQAAAAAITGPLSTNLDGTLVPSPVVGGTKTAKGKVVLVVTNTTAAPVNGQLTGSILASTNGLVESGDLTIGTVSKNVKLKANQTKSIKVKVAFGTPAATADHNLLASLSFGGASGLAVGNKIISVQVPQVTLNASAPAAQTFSFGGKAKLSVPVNNSGNVPAKGTVNLELIGSTDGTTNPASSFTVTNLSGVKVSAKAGGIGTMKVNFTLPSSFPAPNGAGSYTMIVRLTSSSLGAANTTDGATLTSFPFTIA